MRIGVRTPIDVPMVEDEARRDLRRTRAEARRALIAGAWAYRGPAKVQVLLTSAAISTTQLSGMDGRQGLNVKDCVMPAQRL
jgi:hypothetical protein